MLHYEQLAFGHMKLLHNLPLNRLGGHDELAAKPAYQRSHEPLHSHKPRVMRIQIMNGPDELNASYLQIHHRRQED
ncbi:hypothetical protein D3C80_1982230 [compost metagenome]